MLQGSGLRRRCQSICLLRDGHNSSGLWWFCGFEVRQVKPGHREPTALTYCLGISVGRGEALQRSSRPEAWCQQQDGCRCLVSWQAAAPQHGGGGGVRSLPGAGRFGAASRRPSAPRAGRWWRTRTLVPVWCKPPRSPARASVRGARQVGVSLAQPGSQSRPAAVACSKALMSSNPQVPPPSSTSLKSPFRQCQTFAQTSCVMSP